MQSVISCWAWSISGTNTRCGRRLRNQGRESKKNMESDGALSICFTSQAESLAAGK